MTGEIKIIGKDLVFEIEGLDKIFAIKQTIKVPLKHVASVVDDDLGWFKPFPVKMAGTSLPGLVRDGRFVTTKGWVFYVMHNPKKCIVVNLNHEFYKKIIFEVKDKKKAINVIKMAISKNKRAKRA